MQAGKSILFGLGYSTSPASDPVLLICPTAAEAQHPQGKLQPHTTLSAGAVRFWEQMGSPPTSTSQGSSLPQQGRAPNPSQL